jgi:hypothetical protein
MDNKRLARIALVTLLALGCFLILRPFIAAILFAVIVCITTWPLHAWLLAHLGGRPALTSALHHAAVDAGGAGADGLSRHQPGGCGAGAGREAARAWSCAPPWGRRSGWASIPFIGSQLDAYWHSLAESREEFNKLLKQLYDPARKVLLKTSWH